MKRFSPSTLAYRMAHNVTLIEDPRYWIRWDRIDELRRRRRNCSWAHLATRCGRYGWPMDRGHLYALFYKKELLHPWHIDALSAALECTIEDLISGGAAWS